MTEKKPVCQCNISGHGHPATASPPNMEVCGAPATLQIQWTEYGAHVSKLENPTYGCDPCFEDLRRLKGEFFHEYVEKIDRIDEGK